MSSSGYAANTAPTIAAMPNAISKPVRFILRPSATGARSNLAGRVGKPVGVVEPPGLLSVVGLERTERLDITIARGELRRLAARNQQHRLARSRGQPPGELEMMIGDRPCRPGQHHSSAVAQVIDQGRDVVPA